MLFFKNGKELSALGVACHEVRKAGGGEPAVWAIDEEVVLCTGYYVTGGIKCDVINGALIGELAIVRDPAENFESGFRTTPPHCLMGKRVPVERPEIRHREKGHLELHFIVEGIEGLWRADAYRRDKYGFIVGDRAKMPKIPESAS